MNQIKSLIYSFMIVILLISCKDDPVTPQEEHFEAIGTAIYDASGSLVVSILRGVTNDTLKIKNGVLSDHFDVKFYDENEKIIDPPTDEHTKLNYSIDDETISTFWQHPGEEGGYEFHLKGIKQGLTKLELFIEHEGHNDYRSGKIPVKVE